MNFLTKEQANISPARMQPRKKIKFEVAALRRFLPALATQAQVA